MQVNAINAYSNVNFGKKQKPQNTKKQQPVPVQEPSKHSSSIAKAPLYAMMMLLPLGAGVTSCKPDLVVRAHAEATATAIPVGGDTIFVNDTIVTPPDTIVMPKDTIYMPGETVIKNDTVYLPGDTVITPADTVYLPGETIITPADTVYLPGDTVIKKDTVYTPGETVIQKDTVYLPGDTVVKKDTVVQKDTVYIPPTFQFPREIEDSLNIWRGDYLKTPVDGDDGYLKDKALIYLAARRAWEYNRLETFKLNLMRSDSTEARYDHTIYDPKTGGVGARNDIRVTLVKPGDLTVVTENGEVTDKVSGLLFNEDGVKTFAHSNGRDKIYIYDKHMSGENAGKFVFRGTVERGYLTDPKYGQNILLNGILAEDTEDHMVKVNGKVLHVADIMAMTPEERLVLD